MYVHECEINQLKYNNMGKLNKILNIINKLVIDIQLMKLIMVNV